MDFSQVVFIQGYIPFLIGLFLFFSFFLYFFYLYSDKSAFRSPVEEEIKTDKVISLHNDSSHEAAKMKNNDLLVLETKHKNNSLSKLDYKSLNSFISNFKDVSIDTDLIITNFILLFLVSFDYFKQIKYLFMSSDFSNNNRYETLEVKEKRQKLALKTNYELRKILDDVEIFESFSNQQLIDIIIANPKALDRLIIEERKQSLSKKTNRELRELLTGMDNISRLKKSQLVEMIIQNQKDRRQREKIFINTK